MAKEEYVLSSDKPISNPNDDALGYSDFSRNLAKSLSRGSFEEGIVLSIYGNWGAGKSTAISFLERHINQIDDEISITYFNPWWFSGEDALLKSFFAQLQSLFTSWKSKGKKLAKKVGAISEVLAKAPIAEVKAVDALIKKLLSTDLNNTKKEIESLLRKEKKKIIIIIDDIDRLTGEETKQLFKIVKAVANFPYIAYVLAFDRKIVAQAIEKALDVSGDDYIEKIIQVPFELPAPEDYQLADLFFRKINLIFSNVPEKEHDQTYFGNLYHDGIKYFLKTPRDIVRLANALSITYPSIAKEVNHCDFLAIETIRIFEPDIYDCIRRQEDLFAGIESDSRYGQSVREEKQNQLREIINKAKNIDTTTMQELLERLFPRVESLLGNMGYTYDSLLIWRKEKRVCSPELFSIYFRFTLPINGVSVLDVKSVLESAGDVEKLADYLRKLSTQQLPSGKSKLSVVLSRILDYIDDFDKSELTNLVSTIFEIGDELLLPSDDPQTMYDEWGNEIRLGRIMFQSLKKYSNDQDERFVVLQNAFLTGKAVHMMASEAVVLGQQHGKYSSNNEPKEDCLITIEQQEKLESIALNKIREATDNETLEIGPNIVSTLFSWQNWGEDAEPVDWIRSKVEKSPSLFTLLLKDFTTKSHSHGWGDRVARTKLRLNVKSLSHFIELEFAKSIATELLKNAENGDLEYLELFLSECEHFESSPDEYKP